MLNEFFFLPRILALPVCQVLASKNSINSVVGPGSFFEGKFYVSGSVRFDGRFEGEIKTEDTLVVGQTGKIKTNIQAKNVVVEGTMIGNINAKDTVRLEATGKVLGDINAPTVHMAAGVVAKGSINITGNNNKRNARHLVEEAYVGGSGLKNKPSVAAKRKTNE